MVTSKFLLQNHRKWWSKLVTYQISFCSIQAFLSYANNVGVCNFLLTLYRDWFWNIAKFSKAVKFMKMYHFLDVSIFIWIYFMIMFVTTWHPPKSAPWNNNFFKYENNKIWNKYEHHHVEQSFMCLRIFFLWISELPLKHYSKFTKAC